MDVQNTTYKYCFVPGCDSTTKKCPDKVFFSIPANETERRKWLSSSRRESSLAAKTHAHCCEDHFDLEADMESYVKFKTYKEMGFNTQAILKKGVIPHKFECQGTLPKKRKLLVEKLALKEFSLQTCPSSGEQSKPMLKDEDDGHHKFIKNMDQATIQIVESNPEFYTGVNPESFKILEKIMGLCKLPKRDILLTLKKLKLNYAFTCLGDDFGISPSTASKVFSTTTLKLAANLKTLIYFPDKEILAKNMPFPFRRRYSNVTALIDCFEVNIEKPAEPKQQSLTWSVCKKEHTVKFLVSYTPHGFINFVSGGYGGHITDKILTRHCGYIDSLERGDHVMTVKSFQGLDPLLKKKGICLVRPPSVLSCEKNKTSLLQIIIKRTISRLLEFKLISPDTQLDSQLIPILNCAVIVICALCNLQRPLLLI